MVSGREKSKCCPPVPHQGTPSPPPTKVHGFLIEIHPYKRCCVVFPNEINRIQLILAPFCIPPTALCVCERMRACIHTYTRLSCVCCLGITLQLSQICMSCLSNWIRGHVFYCLCNLTVPSTNLCTQRALNKGLLTSARDYRIAFQQPLSSPRLPSDIPDETGCPWWFPPHLP